MACFGWSVQDIFKAIQIAQTIWETWFDKYKRADAQYVQFGRDVKQFQSLLEQFSQVFEVASVAQRKQLPTNEFDTWEANTHTQRREVVGSFTDTLDECKQLLIQNEKYLKKKANIWDNAKWHLAGASDSSERLRSKLRFHAAKIDLLISFDIKANIVALRDEVERLPSTIQQPFREGLPPVPHELSIRYSEALDKDAPVSYTNIANFPLREGLDALISAFDQSTAKISASSSVLGIWPPSVEEINNLVKARFIFHCMLRSHRLRDAGRDSPWAFAVASLLKKLEAEYRKWNHDIEGNIQSVASLNPESFQIWIPPEISATKLATEPDETQGEEKILEVPLADSTEQVNKVLIVFRRPSNELRLLTFISSTTGVGGEISSHEVEKIVNLHTAEVVPRYALPPNLRTPPNMELCFPGASSGYTYQFKTRDDLKKFQQALLGYKVVFEESCQWAIHCSNIIKNSKLKGRGFVQILLPKPLKPTKQWNSATDTDPGTSFRNRTETILSDHSSMTDFTRRLSLTPTMRVQESRDSFIAAHPHAPVLLILTEVDGQPTFIHVRLTREIGIKKKHCNCNSENTRKREACRFTILESSSSKFQVRRFSVPSEKPTLWNLSLLGLPKHPKFDRLDEVKNVSWLSIEMNPNERSQLQEALEITFKIRNRQQKDFDEAENFARHAAERPATSLRPPSLRSPSVTQSEFSLRESTSTSLPRTASSSTTGPSRAQTFDSQTLIELSGDSKTLNELCGDSKNLNELRGD